MGSRFLLSMIIWTPAQYGAQIQHEVIHLLPMMPAGWQVKGFHMVVYHCMFPCHLRAREGCHPPS